MDGFAYLPGDEPKNPGPLSRFLPPAPDGIAAAFLARHSKPGDWVLDPFGSSPRTILEMARLGFRVLVPVNNPVTRFLVETAAHPPSQADLSAALAELASARKGDERLETHLQSLYLTECTKCRRQVPADAFVWDREKGELTARLYRCSCGESGEFPASEADQALAASFSVSDRLHRSRALERVTTPQDPDRVHVEEALECYLPRAIYALITIINKIDGFSLKPERQRALSALLLTACDEASSLWPHPDGRPRPKQLTIPSRFLEKNVWQSLERSQEFWSDGGQVVEVVNWPSLPREGGGLCLFEGPMRNLAPGLKNTTLGAVVTVLPRPNQAFWTLSALWSGWLWGREAAAPFKSVLHRRRYDWAWHAAALYAALKNLSDHLPLNTPLFAIVPEPEPAFLSAALLAATGSGFDLSGMALRTRHDPVQVLWQRRAFSHTDKEPANIDDEALRQAMVAALQERGEPAPFLLMQAAGLIAMAEGHGISWRPDALSQMNAPILAALAGPEFVHHSENKNPETGLWGLTELDPATDSLPDRVELILVRYLLKNPVATLRELETALNTELSGLLTPSLGILRAVLTSYALETDGRWTLRPEDYPSARRADLETATQALTILGSKVGFSVQRLESPQRLVLWQAPGKTEYVFYLLASAVAGRILRQNPYPPEQSLLVLPGGRAGLLAYKLDRDPALRKLAEPWRIVKFRALRRLAGMTGITWEHFQKELSGDPIEPPEQMRLF
jgi:hypothetical protein